MRSMLRLLPRRRTLVLIALSSIGIFNGLMLVKPWASDTVAVTAMAEAAAPRPSDGQSAGARSLISMGKTTLLPEDEQRRVRASLMFMSYFLLSTRSLGARCGELGEDVGAVARDFAAAHHDEYERASAVLGANGLNADIVWALYGRDLEALTQGHFNQYSRLYERNAAGVCQLFAAEPAAFTRQRSFAKNYPDLHKSLMTE